uniref:Uncharacterized protein n=1 Tax=Glossina brevipalpis TaxID=37001 RepID=A0A1A9W0N4_9MUSC
MFFVRHNNPETYGTAQFPGLVLTAFSLVYERIPHNPNWTIKLVSVLSIISPALAVLSPSSSSSLSEASSDSEAEPALEEEPSEPEASLPNISRLKPFISNIAPVPFDETSVNFMPHSFKKAIATSTESSVGISTNSGSFTFTSLAPTSPSVELELPLLLSLLVVLELVFSESLPTILLCRNRKQLWEELPHLGNRLVEEVLPFSNYITIPGFYMIHVSVTQNYL